MRKRQPMQPVIRDSAGNPRFQENTIVNFLLSVARKHDVDLCTIARLPFPRGDREQFAQLIGYSVGGFSELSYVRDSTYERAEAKAAKLPPQAATEEVKP